MPKPSEHKTVQSRILEYAQEIGRTFVPRAEANRRRSFQATVGSIAGQVSTGVVVLRRSFLCQGPRVQARGQGTKVIKLVRRIEKLAEESGEDPFLITMAERARGRSPTTANTGRASCVRIWGTTNDWKAN